MSQRLQVLIAEDERPIAELLARLVQECGAEPIVAYDGAQASEKRMRQRPQLVLLDLIMPLAEGEEVLATMTREQELAEIPVLIITTQEMSEVVTRVQKSNVAVLLKPFRPADVRRRVREALAHTAE